MIAPDSTIPISYSTFILKIMSISRLVEPPSLRFDRRTKYPGAAAQGAAFGKGHAMSKNYDFMRAMEREHSFHSERVIEPALPISSENRNLGAHRQSPSDSTLGLVQRIFLQRTEEPPRMVVFAGIDHGNGCSQIAASVAETLAGNASGAAVCLVEANFRSPSLPAMLGTTNYHGLTDALVEAPCPVFRQAGLQ